MNQWRPTNALPPCEEPGCPMDAAPTVTRTLCEYHAKRSPDPRDATLRSAWDGLDAVMAECGMPAKLQPQEAQAWLRQQLAGLARLRAENERLTEELAHTVEVSHEWCEFAYSARDRALRVLESDHVRMVMAKVSAMQAVVDAARDACREDDLLAMADVMRERVLPALAALDGKEAGSDG